MGRKRKSTLGRKSPQKKARNAESHRKARENDELRAREQIHNTEAHQQARQNDDVRSKERFCNTKARREARQKSLKLGMLQKRKLGALCDVQQFREDITEQHEHKLSSLFDSGRICEFCESYAWREERPGFCCEKGKVSVDHLQFYPDEFKVLFDRRHFLDNMRQYNNAMAMASIGINEQHMPGFSPIVKLQGKVYHRIGPLLPENRETHPKFAQIWFHDSNELENRLRYNEGLKGDIVNILQEYLRCNNPYIQSFKTALEMMENDSSITIVLDAKNRPSREHARRYNLPQTSEISVIIPGEHYDHLSVALHKREGGLQTITELHRSYDPLHYVLMFPRGEEGYKLNIPHTKGRGCVSPSEFARFRLQVREHGFNQVMKCRRLTQQYACDQYAKAEAARLRWARQNQKTIRADKYQGLMDAVHHQEELQAGTKIILPPSIYGSPRWYAEAFQDAMAIVRKFGKPDLFLTFTCNPQWPEITSSLFVGEKASDRPDLTNRVFHLKLQALMNDLKSGVLGKVEAYFGMKEDQKRGLPHCHILVILADVDKPRDPDAIDRIVSAEIPDPSSNPKLHSVITRNNLHGPCGNLNLNSSCMTGHGEARKCEKEFPKHFIEHTTVSNSTYPVYRRRSPDQGGLTCTKKLRGQDVQLDNSWIVPFNPWLSLKYNAHINVEIVNSVSSVKYIYKYITKGSDRVTVKLANGEEKDISNDEIQCYVDARYISASEAYWRLYEFPIQQMKPSVQKLPLHLEDEQVVLFQTEDLNKTINQGPPKTKLTEFFKLNQTTDLNITYPDVLKHFRWVQNHWQRRSRVTRLDRTDNDAMQVCSDTVGRIPVINLSARQSELFYLRMLLHIVVGPKSFTDLRTHNGVEYPTYQATCLAMGLLEDSTEIDRAMEEAASIRFGSTLRTVFAHLLIFATPPNPPEFWNRHRNLLVDDILSKFNLSEPTEPVIHTALLEINQVVQRHGLDIHKDFKLPTPDKTIAEQLGQAASPIIEEETNYDTNELTKYVEQNHPKLNQEQLAMYDAVIDSIDNDKNILFSLDAPGGTGKTFLLSLILARVRSDKKVALATAMSGIAATLLPNGRTLHSRCKVPLSLTEESVCSISRRDSTGKLLIKCHLLVIDEVSMCDRRIIEALDRTLRDLRQTDKLFGGITLIFSGDWRQILPVVRRGGRADTVAATLKRSPLWKNVQIFQLSQNMRVHNAGSTDEFSSELLQIGEGKLPIEVEFGEFKVKLKDEYVVEGSTVKNLTDIIFSELATRYSDGVWLCNRTILCPTNDAVEEVNNIILKQFPGSEVVYRSSDRLIDIEKSHQYPVEFLNSISASGMPPHRLCLKKGCPVMLLRNFDPQNGHCNGSRYIIENLTPNLIDARLAVGPHAGKQLFIPRIPIIPTDELFPFQMQRKQFPIRLCFSMTANKAQGQTLQTVGIYIKNDFFSHGQLYVAMSRVGSSENVKIFARNGHIPDKKATFINNVVYPEILT